MMEVSRVSLALVGPWSNTDFSMFLVADVNVHFTVLPPSNTEDSLAAVGLLPVVTVKVVII